MQSMGPGGGMFMNIYSQKEQQAYSILAREKAPNNISETFLNSKLPKPLRNALTIAIPNEVRGYALAHAKFGHLAWATLIDPTIKLCHSGFRLSKHQHDALQTNQDMVLLDTHLRRTFLNFSSGKFYRAGAHIKPARELCTFYELLAEEGPDSFYEGQLARLLAKDLQELGSNIDEEDFRQVTAKMEHSVALPLGEYRLHLVPPPSSGLIIGFIMNTLKNFRDNFGSEKRELTVNDIHRIVEAFKFGFVKRWYLDMESDDEFVNDLISYTHGIRIARLINDSVTSSDPWFYGARFDSATKPDHGTAHISVLAANGDAVSVTSSINFYFGSGLTGARTGLLFNNALNDFSIDGYPNYFGLPNVAKRNSLKRHQTPMSSMSPLIVTDRQQRVRLVVGAAGGTKIITSLIPLLVRVLWLKYNIKEAIDSTRFHHQLLPDVLEYEYGMLKDLVADLNRRGHKTKRYRERGSAICGIEKIKGGLYANADYRKEGGVAGF